MYPLPNGYRFSLLYLDVPAPRPALPLTVTDDGQHGHPSPPVRCVPPLAASYAARPLPRLCATMDASSWAAHESAAATTCSLPSVAPAHEQHPFPGRDSCSFGGSRTRPRYGVRAGSGREQIWPDSSQCAAMPSLSAWAQTHDVSCWSGYFSMAPQAAARASAHAAEAVFPAG